MDGPLDRYHAPQWLGAKVKRRFHVMAKPAGSACNLDCGYCFYLSKPALAGGPGAGHMDDEVLELFVRQYIAGVTGDEVVFSWQGGEPTLLGLDFFRKVVALQQKHAKPGQRIENDLQTNGTLLDEDWARFLKEHRFLVGLSIDGPRELHDRISGDQGRCADLRRGARGCRLLRRFGVRFNTLTCVSRCNASRPLDVYRFLRRELGSTYLQFIPVVQAAGSSTIAPGALDPSSLPLVGEPRRRPDHPESVVTEWSVDPEEYGRFLCSVWDEWRRQATSARCWSISLETLVAQHSGCRRRSASTARSAARAWQSSMTVASMHAITTSIPSIGSGTCGRRRRSPTWCSRRRRCDFGYAKSRDPAALLPRVRVPERLLGRVPEESVAASA